ncbi:MAG: GNAT family N-acetyltransferase [Acidimicrobiales bacterium]
MTSPTPTDDKAGAAEAWRRARAAALASGLTVRELAEPAEHRAAEALLASVWSVRPEQAPVPGDVMRSLSYTGGYVAGAFAEDELIGAAVGFLATGAGASPLRQLHSHVAGVIPSAQGRHVGSALKLHQRAWALERGLGTITWTFDPLVRRNAFFNLTKLGAGATTYLTDFYGEMRDGINEGQGSDRLLVRWDLCSEKAAEAAAGRVAEPVPGAVGAIVEKGRVLLGIGPEGEPRPGSDAGVGLGPGSRGGPAGDDSGDGSGGRREPVACAVPGDIEALRRSDPELALAWRSAIRRTLAPAMAGGMRIAGFARSGWYVLSYGDEEEVGG